MPDGIANYRRVGRRGQRREDLQGERDEQPELAKEYRVMSIPTLMVFKDGKPVKREVGAKSKAEILEMLK